jgi:pilus assembly protein FimV
LVREYTALIDPPSFMVGKAPTVEAPQAEEPVEEANADDTQPADNAQSPFVQTVPPPQEAEQADTQTAAAPAAPIPEPLAPREVDAQPADEKAPSQPLIAAEPTKEALPKEETASAPTERVASQAPAAPAVTPPAAPGDASWASAGEYNVRSGDTLWAIADRMRADKQLTLEQVMVAIFRNNRDAFFRDNVNNLRAGKILKMPERDEIDATPPTEARREFRAQYDSWQEYKLKLAGGSRTLKVAEGKAPDEKPTAAPVKDTAAKNVATKETPAAQGKPAKDSQELLKVVRGSTELAKPAPSAKPSETESAKDVSTRERSALAERVTTLEESLQSKQLENRELTEKLGQVRSQIKNERRLIELENQTLARQTAKPAKPAEPPAPVAKPEPKAEAAPAPIVAVPKKEPEIAKEPQPAPAPAPAPAPKPLPKKPPAVAAAPPEKSFISSILDEVSSLDSSMMPLLGGGVALVGGAILILYLRRRRRSIAEFEESILASDAIASSDAASATTSADTTGQVTSGDTSFLSDFSKSGMGQVHTDEVDPIAEAEVYLAYGRDETAEEILKEAIVKNPDRQELKQKLLEIYHQRNDVNAFETLAEELYAALGGRGGKIWEKVEEMGRKLNPENPMFRGGAPAARRAADKPAERPVAQGMRSAVTQPAASTMAAAAAGGAAVAAATQLVDSHSSSVDFDFETPAASSSTAAPSLEFDLSALDEKPASAKGGAAGDDLGGIEFESGSSNLVDFDATKSASVPDAPAGDDDIKWEVDAPAAPAAAAEAGPGSGNGAEGGHWDETATKLDLAKAYIDMGDSEGARSILDEVLAEGNEQQKKQAAELAAQIA